MERSDSRSSVVDLTWRPCLAFYEQGVPLLRALETAGLLRRFRVREHDVEAVLRDGSRLEVGVSNMTYSCRSLAADQALEVITGVLSLMEPIGVEPVFFLQHLTALPWDLSYEEACLRATHAWMPSLAMDLGLHDMAPLVDGRARHDDLKYQAEFGVIRREEAPERLSRHLGNRIGGPEMPADSDPDAYPELGVFVDSTWFPQDVPPDTGEMGPWLLNHLAHSVEEAQELTTALQRVCVDSQTQDQDGGESNDSRGASQVPAGR